MKDNFGRDKKSGFGRTIAILSINGKDEAEEMISVFNAAIRAGVTSDNIRKWRAQVLNLRAKAHQKDWVGWE